MPARPAHIHTGTCDEVGEVVAPLTDLTGATGGDRVGQARRAIPAESSFTSVPMTLDAILGADHVVNVHLSAEEIGTYIACGEIGGPTTADGAIVIGLKQQSDSGFTGIAFLAPGADGASTDVSVFVAEELAGGEAAAETGAVAVSLTEWAIEMPSTLPAGPTTFELTNVGEFPHTIEIEGEGIEVEGEVIEAGQSTTLEVDLAPGTYTVYCPVGDGRHREQGMELELTVE